MAFVENTATPGDITTDAAFRAWALALREAVEDAGLVRTADTGQIDLTTVSAPATSAYAGYDIFRFDDAAQATDPVFLKVEYGKGTATTRHALRLTVGTGSDGAGTITNAATPVASVGAATASGNGTIVASFFDGAFVLNDAYVNSSAGNVLLVVERLRDYEGDLKAGAAGVFVLNNGSPTGAQMNGGVWTNSRTPVPVVATQAGDGAMIFGYLFYDSYPYFPFRSVLFGAAASMDTGDQGSVDVDGVACTYKAITDGAFTGAGGTQQLIRKA